MISAALLRMSDRGSVITVLIIAAAALLVPILNLVVPPSWPSMRRKVRVGTNQSCSASPPTPSGVSSVCSGPAPNPSSETAKQ
jgi:hypothetical protein